MNTLGELALREAQLKTQLEAVQAYMASVKAQYDGAREQVQAALDSEESRGVTQFGALMPTGHLIAKVLLLDPDPAPYITDELAFKDWVRDNYPTEHSVRFVREVRTAWQSTLFKAMQKLGKPVDPTTGELVPGIAIPEARKRSHRLTFETDGQEHIAAAIREGSMPADVLPELLAMPDDPDEA